MSRSLSDSASRDVPDRQDWSASWNLRVLSIISGGLLFLFVAARVLIRMVS